MSLKERNPLEQSNWPKFTSHDASIIGASVSEPHIMLYKLSVIYIYKQGECLYIRYKGKDWSITILKPVVSMDTIALLVTRATE